MPVFVISTDSTQADSTVGQKISEKLSATEHRSPWPGFYLVRHESTAKELSDLLGISDGAAGRFFITALGVGAYWGFGKKENWDWLALKQNEK